MRRLILTIFLIALQPSIVSAARAAYGADPIEGWRSDFLACRDEALSGKIPLVLVWGHDRCPHCKALAADMATNSLFKAWQKDAGFIFCHVIGRRGRVAKEIRLAKSFAATAGGTRTAQPSSYPYVCLYQKLDDGKVLAESFTTQSAIDMMETARGLFAGSGVSNGLHRAAAPAVAREVTPLSFCGSYTVQLPFLGANSNDLVRGDASLSIRILPSLEVGAPPSIAYSAILPDGSAMNGTAPFKMVDVLDGNGKTSKVVRLDVAGSTETGSMRLPLQIKPFAADSWKNPSVPDGLSSVFASEGATPTFTSKDSTKARALSVYGGFYRRGRSPRQLCDLFDFSPRMSLKVRAKDMVSDRFGKAVSLPGGKLVAGKKTFSPGKKKSNISFSYGRADGMIQGKGEIKFATRTVPGEFKGIVLPGWVDCHCGTKFTPRPFASGLFSFKDYKKNGTNWVEVTRSVPFEIKAK